MGENGQEKVIERQVYQTLKKADTAMAKKIKIRKVSAWTMGNNCSAGDHVCDHFL